MTKSHRIGGQTSRRDYRMSTGGVIIRQFSAFGVFGDIVVYDVEKVSSHPAATQVASVVSLF